MRVSLANDSDAQNYAEYLLRIGNGTEEIISNEFDIELPDWFNLVENLDDLINNIYKDIDNLYDKENYLSHRAILSPIHK